MFFLVAYYIWKSMYELQYRVETLEQRLAGKSKETHSTNNPTKLSQTNNQGDTGSSFNASIFKNLSNQSNTYEGGGGEERGGFVSKPTDLENDLENVFIEAPLSIVQRIIGEEHILNSSELLENVGLSLSNMVNEGIRDLMMDTEKGTFSSFIFTSTSPLQTDESEKRVFEVVNEIDEDVSEPNIQMNEEAALEVVEKTVLTETSKSQPMETMVNEYRSKTVSELKVICQSYGLPTSKNSGQKTKKELVDTIVEYMEHKKEDGVAK